MTAQPLNAPLVVVMGVAGAGKSAVGEALAVRLGIPFVDGDSLHSPASIAKMAAGEPLNDDDRWPWLEAIGALLLGAGSHGGLVVACSALKLAYRDAIRAVAPQVFFVHLVGSDELLAERIGARAGHFMSAAMLNSQLATLEPLTSGESGALVQIAPPLADVVNEAARLVSLSRPV